VVAEAGGDLLVGGDGLYRSTDGGQTWNQELEDLCVDSIVVAPSDAAHVYVAGHATCEDGAKQMARATVDGGAHWTSIARAVAAVAPTDPLSVFGSDGKNVWKSVDGGKHFKVAAVPGVGSRAPLPVVELAPSDPTQAYVIAPSAHNGQSIRSTRDGGETWSQSVSSSRAALLAVDPTAPAVLYFGVEDGCGLSRSADGGATLSSVISAPERSQGDASCKGRYLGPLLVESSRPDRVYLAARQTASQAAQVMVSDDGGKTTRELGLPEDGKPGGLAGVPVAHLARAASALIAIADDGTASWIAVP
jgi:photosystem II stability/assembly factor-like uncharacterized protein